jgi:dolichol-phosphate mannosyltransferase
VTERPTLVVVPTYNEAQSIRDVVARLLAAVPDADVLIVDDDSPDGTGVIADDLATSDGRVHVLHQAAKGGLGVAYLAGFQWGLARDYGVLVEMDADGSHQPEQLPAIVGALAGADLVIGTRWMPGGGTANWPLRRQLLSRGASLYTRLLLGVPARDATAGFRAYRDAVLRAIDLDSIRSQGYAFQIEMLWRTVQAGFRVAEVPIIFVERETGVSKMTGGIVWEAVVNVARWGIERLRRRQPLRRRGRQRAGRPSG